MKKITALAVFILASLSLSLGQGERYQSQVTTNGLPNPVVRVCTEVASGNPCISLASIFADKPLTTPLPNPFTGDAEGNYFFYGSCANTYHVQIFQNGVLIFEQADVALPGCGSGGGGGVNPGTPFQVTRYDSSGNNIQDSTGSDNPANGPTRWVQGLSVEGNGLAKVGINSPTGTTLNLLVCADPAITSMTQVLTCPVSTNKTFGIADNGAGTTGNVRIYDHGYHSCIFDGQTVVNDYVAPSATVPAACSDVGATKPNNVLIIGRVTTLNTGAGTLATVDLQPWDTVAPGSAGGSGTVSNCASSNSNAYYVSPGTVVNCDPQVTDDGAGNLGAQSLGLNNPTYAGFLWQKAGPLPPDAPAGTIEFFPPTSLTNPFSMQWPTAPGSALQCYQVLSTSTDGSGHTIDNMGFGACGGSITFQTNGVNNAAQNLLDIVQGPNCTITNTSGGHVQVTCTGGLPTTTIGTPTAPTLANQNAAGARSITYLVQGLEDVAGVYHTLTSATATIANANASPQVLLSAYGDTLYGPRCYDVYVTADASRAALGLIAHCVGKKFIDTGTTGNGVSATNTNTTVLTINMSPFPGCNIPPNGIIGVDAPPCSPTVYDGENGNTFGVPADANDGVWSWGGGGTSPCIQDSAAASWTGGTIDLVSGATAGTMECLVESTALPGTPYTFVTFVSMAAPTGSNTGCHLGLRESSTGKMVTIGLTRNSTLDQQGGIGSWMGVLNWTTKSANSIVHLMSFMNDSFYFKIQNTGTNVILSWSPSSDGVNYTILDSEALTTPFTTAPNQVFIGTDAAALATTCTFDYLRRTQ